MKHVYEEIQRGSAHPAYNIPRTFDADRTRNYFIESILLLLLLLTAFVPAEIASVFYVAVIVIFLFAGNLKIKRGLISLVSPFFFLFLLGMLEAHRHPLLDVMKDVWYLVKVVLALGAGYVLMHRLRSFEQLCRLVVAAAVIAAMFHLFRVVMVIQSGFSLMNLRNDAGGGDFITTVGLGLLVGVSQVRKFIGFNRWYYYLSVALCTASLMASGSRTNIISFALIFFILKGWGWLNLKTCLTLALLGTVAAIVFIYGSLLGNYDETSLLGKFLRSTTEVAIRNYEDMSDINSNWRGFEGYRAYRTYLDGGSFVKSFGQGFGSKVDLGFYMPLAGSEYRYIPVLHNGYMYVLLKYGLIGMLVYLYFIFKLIRGGSNVLAQQSVDLILARRLMSALGCVFLFSTLVITGLFNKSVFDSSLIVLGAIVAWLNIHKKFNVF